MRYPNVDSIVCWAKTPLSHRPVAEARQLTRAIDASGARPVLQSAEAVGF